MCVRVCVAGAEVWHPMCKEAIGMEKKLRVSMLLLSTQPPSMFCCRALFTSLPTGPMNQQPPRGFLQLSFLGTANLRLLSIKKISIILSTSTSTLLFSCWCQQNPSHASFHNPHSLLLLNHFCKVTVFMFSPACQRGSVTVNDQ